MVSYAQQFLIIAHRDSAIQYLEYFSIHWIHAPLIPSSYASIVTATSIVLMVMLLAYHEDSNL